MSLRHKIIEKRLVKIKYDKHKCSPGRLSLSESFPAGGNLYRMVPTRQILSNGLVRMIKSNVNYTGYCKPEPDPPL